MLYSITYEVDGKFYTTRSDYDHSWLCDVSIDDLVPEIIIDELPYHLRNTMDKDQQADTDKLIQRAVAPCVADFIQSLAEWGFNHVEHTMLWEAMCGVIEAGERGELDDVIDAIEGDE